MDRAESVLRFAKTVVGPYKDRKHRLEVLQFSGKTPAAARQGRDIMAQIGIDALHREGVILVVNVENVLPGKDHVQITGISVCAVSFCLRSRVHHALDRPRAFIPAYGVSHDLPRAAAHHRHDVDVFTGLCTGPVFQEPVQLV